MFRRAYWISRIESLLNERNVLWLAGVRRVGKTCLCQSLENIDYFDCELPRVRRQMEDPEAFLNALRGHRIVLDEIHRLENPSQLLKIAADHFPETRVVATGSSTLSASTKFKDTLTGRKRNLWLTPLVADDLTAFRNDNLEHRFLFGGLPGTFTESVLPEKDFQEWMDAYWAKDIQELFRLERRHAFTKFAEMLMINSGGVFEATKYARPCEVSRTTISNYLSVLEATLVAHVVRPFSTHRSTEIVSAPKVYAFDTGFVCYYRGWGPLRPDDFGDLWEHFVLNELHGTLQRREVNYWRTKQGLEVDFVLQRRGRPPVAIECKWRSDHASLRGLRGFSQRYPGAELYVVSHDVEIPRPVEHRGLTIHFVNLRTLIRRLSPRSSVGAFA